MTEMKKTKDVGFTLIELIIVILILGVLAAVLAPQVIKYIEKAQRNVCDNNMTEIANSYRRTLAEDGSVTYYDVILNKDSRFFTKAVKCPIGGDYVAAMAEDGSRKTTVFCTEHSEGGYKVNAQTVSVLQKVMSMTDKEKQEYLGTNDNNFTNDVLRRKIVELLGGEYEKMSANMQKKMQETNKNKELYVQPMITKDTENYVLYANTNKDNTASGGTKQWGAYALFDPRAGVWYEYTKKHTYNGTQENYDLANKTYEQIMNEILENHPEDWRVLN